MDSKKQKLEERLEKGERSHEEERFNKVNEAGPSISSASTGASEAPVEAEEMEGPVQLWAGAETIKLEELQKRRKKRGIYRKPKNRG